jgi:hypothetical protein
MAATVPQNQCEIVKNRNDETYDLYAGGLTGVGVLAAVW